MCNLSVDVSLMVEPHVRVLISQSCGSLLSAALKFNNILSAYLLSVVLSVSYSVRRLGAIIKRYDMHDF